MGLGVAGGVGILLLLVIVMGVRALRARRTARQPGRSPVATDVWASAAAPATGDVRLDKSQYSVGKPGEGMVSYDLQYDAESPPPAVEETARGAAEHSYPSLPVYPSAPAYPSGLYVSAS